jgi:hypothetical protein
MPDGNCDLLQGTSPDFNQDPFLSEKEAAVYLDVSLATIRRRRYEGTGPRYIRFGEIRYRRSWLDEFATTNQCQKKEPDNNNQVAGSRVQPARAKDRST